MSYFRGRRSGNHLYAIISRREQEDLPDVVTGVIQIFTFDVLPKQLLDPISVSTHVGESILLEKVIVIVPFLSIIRVPC